MGSKNEGRDSGHFTTARGETRQRTPSSLSLLAAPRTGGVPAPAASGAQLSRSRVLVVDDFEDARALYSTALELAGFHALEAESGAAALEAVSDTPPDLIVLDISMPGMNGWEVVRRLQANDLTRTIPVVIVTGSGFGGRPRNGEPGCAAYLTKPCPPSTLISVVRTVLGAQR